MAIKGIVFDKDGVLVDVQRTHGPSTLEVISILANHDADTIRLLADAVEFDPSTSRFRPQSILIAGTAADIAGAWHPHLAPIAIDLLIARIETLFDDVTVKHVSPFEDVAGSLAALRGMGLSLALATNDTQESAHRHLTAIGEKQSFDFIAGYDSGHGAKPGPGMILAFAEHLRCAPQELVMVGDSTHDMEAAGAAGAIRVAVTTGLADAGVLAPHADHVVASLSELPALVTRLSES